MPDRERAAEAAPAGSEPPRPVPPRAPTLEDFEVLADALTPDSLRHSEAQEGTTVGGGTGDAPPLQCSVQRPEEVPCSSEAGRPARAARSHRAALLMWLPDNWHPLLDLVDRRGL
jgi:hypothetical protein